MISTQRVIQCSLIIAALALILGQMGANRVGVRLKRYMFAIFSPESCGQGAVPLPEGGSRAVMQAH